MVSYIDRLDVSSLTEALGFADCYQNRRIAFEHVSHRPAHSKRDSNGDKLLAQTQIEVEGQRLTAVQLNPELKAYLFFFSKDITQDSDTIRRLQEALDNFSGYDNSAAFSVGRDKRYSAYQAVAQDASLSLAGAPKTLLPELWPKWPWDDGWSPITYFSRRHVSFWTNLLFNLAWQNISGSPVTADRWAWNGGWKSTLEDNPKHRKFKRKGLLTGEKGVPADGFDSSRWYSVLDDVIKASDHAIDIILTNSQPPQFSNKQQVSAQDDDGVVVTPTHTEGEVTSTDGDAIGRHEAERSESDESTTAANADDGVDSLDPESAFAVKLSVTSWCDLAIGIDEDGGYLGVTHAPHFGRVFPKESSAVLPLNGKRWKKLLDLLAESDDGCTATKADLFSEFGYLSKTVKEEEIADIRHDCGRMNEIKSAKHKPSQTIADFSRELREYVSAPDDRPRHNPPLRASDEKLVRARFTCRHLLRDDAGKLRFGRQD